MLTCTRCKVEFREGAHCSSCQGHFDFPCAGITENGYRKLGDRRNTWKCATCKVAGNSSPRPGSSKASVPVDLEKVMEDLRCLTFQLAPLPSMIETVKLIQTDLKSLKADITDLKLLKTDIADVKASMEFVQYSVEMLTGKVSALDKEVQELKKSKDDLSILQRQVSDLRTVAQEQDQRARMNNMEIKGVPMTNSENLFSLVTNIGNLIQCPITKDQINYIARVPSRGNNRIKSIVVSVLNRYQKDDFVAAARKLTITAADLGLQGGTRIFINDHLTVDNKILLNKAKALAKEKNFAFTWVKGSKIFMRRNPTSPIIAIRTEADLKKLCT
ncbi:PREDICTED: uncharacterized protein LOC106126076 [Papilio xuthus]|uniref:Uncharacterized protein LOC106126076 n=1 Tax=Papilio xuthus TaxID=66420 RepID=A0AAJ7EIT8_PAPXU|nr:PREDICTED: uncharacterized protein LOC106126076 [Papilio xuthus]